MRTEELSPLRVACERRNRDLDPQLVWRGKDEQDWSDLEVHAPPLYIQEKVHPTLPRVVFSDMATASVPMPSACVTATAGSEDAVSFKLLSRALTVYVYAVPGVSPVSV